MNNSIDNIQLITKKKKNLDYYRKRIEQIVKLKLIWRYDIPNTFYNIKMINDIIFNEKSHFVETFKEFLIYGDNNEFLKRFYNRKELVIKLPKILNFYEQYCKIYANYTAIPESKFMYKNIKRKQKVIDQMQWKYYDLYEEDEDEEKEDLSSKIFNTSALKTINSFTMSLYTNYSSFNNTQSDIEAQDLIRKINYYENLSDLIKNNKNKNDNNNNYYKYNCINITKDKNIMIGINNDLNEINLNNKQNEKTKKNTYKDNLIFKKNCNFQIICNQSNLEKLNNKAKNLLERMQDMSNILQEFEKITSFNKDRYDSRYLLKSSMSLYSLGKNVYQVKFKEKTKNLENNLNSLEKIWSLTKNRILLTEKEELTERCKLLETKLKQLDLYKGNKN